MGSQRGSTPVTQPQKDRIISAFGGKGKKKKKKEEKNKKENGESTEKKERRPTAASVSPAIESRKPAPSRWRTREKLPSGSWQVADPFRR